MERSQPLQTHFQESRCKFASPFPRQHVGRYLQNLVYANVPINTAVCTTCLILTDNSMRDLHKLAESVTDVDSEYPWVSDTLHWRSADQISHNARLFACCAMHALQVQ